MSNSEIHHVKATSFADPADLRAFNRAKARGLTDEQAFKYGDNGIGCWEDSTAEGSGPCCALPPEDFAQLAHPRGVKVRVVVGACEVICELRDRMPRRKFITNGAGIDLNPDACRDLGLRPPVDCAATWQFI